MWTRCRSLINPETGRVHTSFNQAVAATGRLSSSDPNLQNIPIRTEVGREVRHAFVAGNTPETTIFDGEPAVLLACDYSQIELRIFAHVSRDEALLEAFREGQDIHTATAAEMFGVPYDAVDADTRRLAKTVNFGIIYGISAFGLANSAGIPQAAGARLHQALLRALPRREAADRIDPRGGAGEGVRLHAARSPPLLPGDAVAQPERPPGRRARRDERADSGHGGGHRQARDDPGG